MLRIISYLNYSMKRRGKGRERGDKDEKGGVER